MESMDRISGSHLRALLAFVALTRVLCVSLLALASFLPLFDTSPRLLLVSSTSTFSRWLSTVLRWDTFHYLHVAKEGYVYEHEWAFFPGASQVMSLLARIPNIWRNSPQEPQRESLLLLGVLAAQMFDGIFVLYELTLRQFKSPQIAFLTALLCLLPASPATLRHTTPEPIFTYLSYKGMLYCAEKRWFYATLMFSLAGTFRSNGVLLSSFLVWGMLIDPALSRQKLSAWTLLRCAAAVTTTTLPFARHQYSAYQAFCISDGTDCPPWCSYAIPAVYSYVQSTYWNVGFMRYWSVQQLPNFVISAPVLALLLLSSVHHIAYGLLPRLQGRVSSPTTNPFLSPEITPHALHALFFTLTLLFAAHTQIILRLAASMPFTYWSAAKLWVHHPQWAVWWTGWSIVWGGISLVLWSTFLPPA